MKNARILMGLTLGAVLVARVAPLYADDMSVISGKVVFKGDVEKYKRSKVDTAKDPNCAKSKPDGIGTENVIVNKKTDPQTLRNVLVTIKSGLGDKAFPPRKDPVTITQVGCRYEPHVVALQEGETLKVLNGDETNHNIHFLPKVNQEHNFSQPKKDTEKGTELKLVAEDIFKVKCDVHPWMGAYVGVFKHPFFSVTGEEGTFEIKGMPPGKYVIEAWHEELGAKTMEVEVSTGDKKTVDFTFEPGK